jgi:hypothetical protein
MDDAVVMRVIGRDGRLLGNIKHPGMFSFPRGGQDLL